MLTRLRIHTALLMSILVGFSGPGTASALRSTELTEGHPQLLAGLEAALKEDSASPSPGRSTGRPAWAFRLFSGSMLLGALTLPVAKSEGQATSIDLKGWMQTHAKAVQEAIQKAKTATDEYNKRFTAEGKTPPEPSRIYSDTSWGIYERLRSDLVVLLPEINEIVKSGRLRLDEKGKLYQSRWVDPTLELTMDAFKKMTLPVAKDTKTWGYRHAAWEHFLWTKTIPTLKKIQDDRDRGALSDSEARPKLYEVLAEASVTDEKHRVIKDSFEVIGFGTRMFFLMAGETLTALQPSGELEAIEKGIAQKTLTLEEFVRASRRHRKAMGPLLEGPGPYTVYDMLRNRLSRDKQDQYLDPKKGLTKRYDNLNQPIAQFLERVNVKLPPGLPQKLLQEILLQGHPEVPLVSGEFSVPGNAPGTRRSERGKDMLLLDGLVTAYFEFIDQKPGLGLGKTDILLQSQRYTQTLAQLTLQVDGAVAKGTWDELGKKLDRLGGPGSSEKILPTNIRLYHPPRTDPLRRLPSGVTDQPPAQPAPQPKQQIAQLWGNIWLTPPYDVTQAEAERAQNVSRRLALIFYESETFGAIPLAAKGGLPFFVIVHSDSERERVQSLLDDLAIDPRQYQIRQREPSPSQPDSIYVSQIMLYEISESYTPYPVSYTKGSDQWFTDLQRRLQQEGVIPFPIEQVIPAVQATERYLSGQV